MVTSQIYKQLMFSIELKIKEKYYSLKEFSKIMGIDPTNLSRWFSINRGNKEAPIMSIRNFHKVVTLLYNTEKRMPRYDNDTLNGCTVEDYIEMMPFESKYMLLLIFEN